MKLACENIDNLGLIAGMCEEIGISDIIDRACGQQAKNKRLTFGQSALCMILNGLGFVGRTLYLYSEYFEDKPVSHLLDCPVEAEHITRLQHFLLEIHHTPPRVESKASNVVPQKTNKLAETLKKS